MATLCGIVTAAPKNLGVCARERQADMERVS